MYLTFGNHSPWDLVDKAKRDLARLEQAEAVANEVAMGDAIFDLAVTIDSVMEWVIEDLGRDKFEKTVQHYRRATDSLAAFRALSVAAKHRKISDFTPTTTDVESSAVSPVAARSGEAQQARVLKVIRTTGARQRASDLARTAIRDWEAFMIANNVTR